MGRLGGGLIALILLTSGCVVVTPCPPWPEGEETPDYLVSGPEPVDEVTRHLPPAQAR